MTIFITDLVERQQDFLHKQALSQTTSLAKTLAANSSSWVLASDIIGMEELIRSQSSYSELKYAMLISKRGRILSHTNTDFSGNFLSDEISLSLIDADPSDTVLINNSSLIDIASPIYANDKHIGWARVGLSQEHVTKGLSVISRDGVIYTLAAILIGVLFAWFMAKGLTSGLQQIVSVAARIKTGERNLRSHLQRDDELGELSNDFNNMLAAMEQHEAILTETQEKLRSNEERFDLAMKGANDGLWDWDIVSDKVYYSPRWKQMLGYSEDMVSDSTLEWDERIHPDDRKSSQFDIEQHLIGKTSLYENIHRIKHKDGNYRWHLERGIAVRNKDGEPTRMVGTTTDITDQIETQNKLQEAKNKLEQRVKERTKELQKKNHQLDIALEKAHEASKTKSMFLANMSHEIRTPMNGIFGMLNLLKETSLNESQDEFVNTAYNSAESLLTILNDILDFSKIEAGKLELERVEFCLHEAVEDVSSLFALRSQEKGIEIINDLDPSIPYFCIGDPTRLRQILSNLISNAIKFTDQGEIIIRSELIKKTKDSIKIYFEVKDTGIGIEKHKLDSIFEAFSQADISTTRKFGGTGLGLAISVELCRLMKGEIGAQSKEGHGSTFWFTVTLGKSDIDTPAYHTIDSVSNKNLLIVDDNETNRIILERQLDAWGIHHHKSVDNAITALELVRDAINNQPYHIILLDMMMPEMDGLQLAKAISQLDADTIPHMIMLTSMSGSNSQELLNLYNVQSCISKPIRQSILYDALISLSNKPLIENTRHTSSSPSSSETNKQHRILLVEDHNINLKVAVGYLNKLGHEVDIAKNGKEALSLFQKHPYELIFMDCQMPVMDGYSATNEIRKMEKEGQHVTIIAITANVMEGDKQKCLDSGMDDYIGKPYKLSVMSEMLSKWLSD